MTDLAAMAPLRVLVVDDVDLDREEIRRMLLNGSERRYVFTDAVSISSGMRATREATAVPDLVVLDYNLPDGTATEFLKLLSGPDGHVVCPVLVITGYEDTALGREVLRAGAQDFVGKAWMTKESLTRAVENATERWVMAAELRASRTLLQTALESAERAVIQRDQLVSLVSHDLRGPLHGIMLSVDALEGQVTDEARTIPARMERYARRMATMLDELLDLSVLRAGKNLTLAVQQVDLVAVTRELVEQMATSSPSHVFDIQATTGTVVGIWDPSRIERVVANLLSNAVKYSPAGGCIRAIIDAVEQDGAMWARLRVEDEGIGIAASELPNVFDWFFRAQTARRAGISGVGVGLAGARTIVEMHSGTIAVTSSLGTGSTFTMMIPLAPPRVVAVAPAA